MTTNHLGGTYLKTGMLKPNRDGSPRTIEVPVSDRNGGARIIPERQNDKGKFGPALEIPIQIEGQDFVASVPADKGDGKLLRTVWGDPTDNAWSGKRVRIYESEVLDRIRVEPAQ